MPKSLLNVLIHTLLILFSIQLYAQQPNDCQDIITVCGDSDILLDVSGTGVKEFDDSCGSNENNSVWLKVNVVKSGTLAFTLTPNSTDIEEDYDFFIFGPNKTCDNLGSTIRCSTTNPLTSGQSNNLTGLSTSETDTSEGPSEDGNSFVSAINANAGESYFIVIDRPLGNSAFELEWTGTAEFPQIPEPATKTPAQITALNLDQCDAIAPYNDDKTGFNLYENTAQLTGRQAEVAIKYYASISDANIGVNALRSPYTNKTNPQTIYARLTNTTTGCFSLQDFQLLVRDSPAITPVEDYIFCEPGPTLTAAEFFLEPGKTNEILNGQDSTRFKVTYHNTQADADTGNNPIGTSRPIVTTFKNIYARITNTITNCALAPTELNFKLEVQIAAEANPDGVAILYPLCDDTMEFDTDTTNDAVSFDLASQNEFVLDGQDPTNFRVRYYETQLEADAGKDANQILNYTNTNNPQEIFARVDNDTMIPDGSGGMTDGSICYETTTLSLKVNPIPAFTLKKLYAICIDENGAEVSLPEIDTKLDPSLYNFLWSFNGTASGDTSPSITATTEGTYTVEVTDKLATPSCPTSVTTLVKRITPPVVQAAVTTAPFSKEHNIEVTITNAVSEYEFSLEGGAWQTTSSTNGKYTFTNVAAGEQTIIVRDRNGCGQNTIKIMVMDNPVYFTPNGDGYNDTWTIYGIDQQPDAIIYIYDRFGKLLKQLSPTDQGWDGTCKGLQMPTNDYWFTIEYRNPNTATNEKQTASGHFTLKR